MKYMRLSEGETAMLIRESIDRSVRLTFPGGDLLLVPENQWAIHRIHEERETLCPDFLMADGLSPDFSALHK